MSDRIKISGVSTPEVEQDLQFVSLIQLQSPPLQRRGIFKRLKAWVWLLSSLKPPASRISWWLYRGGHTRSHPEHGS